ncbi:MAG TPA: hypothetical protein VJL89_11640 [Thermodesulfovibrionia bacterium]|nr:hypothetical protein [Thermodesulfovibrionia bacterium]
MKNISAKSLLVLIIIMLLYSQSEGVFTEKEIPMLEASVSHLQTRDKIVFWARQFIGVPFDPDPAGVYVTNKVIVFDEQVNSMYLVCRSVELALSSTEEKAVEIALDKRFFTRGVIVDNQVQNYNERYEYPMDMILSSKWGKNVTEELGPTVDVEASRIWDTQKMLPATAMHKWISKLQNGDLIFFVKDKNKWIRGDVIGHMGIVEKSKNGIYVIHAKGVGGVLAEELGKYLKASGFTGVQVTRF